MPTRSMSRSVSSSNTSSRTTTMVRKGTSRRPPVLRRRDHNLQASVQSTSQTTLTSMMSSSAAAPVYASAAWFPPGLSREAGTRQQDKRAWKEPTQLIVITSDDEDDEEENHDAPAPPGLPRKRQQTDKTKRQGVDRDTNGAANSMFDLAQRGEAKSKTAGELERLGKENEELKRTRDRYAEMAQNMETRAKEAQNDFKALETSLKSIKDKSRHTDERLGVILKLNEELEKQLSDMEIKLQRKKLKRNAHNFPLDPTELDDLIACKICMGKMWQPATIRECGHTFCQSCLHEWFNQTYTQHVDQHPEFLNHAPPQIPREYIENQHIPELAGFVQMARQMIAEWKRTVPQPIYTCPTCRGEVKSPPLEIYFVKDVVGKVVELLNSHASEGGTREGSSDVPERTNSEDLWDGFFPEY